MKPVFLPNDCLCQPKQVAKESTCIHDNDTVEGRNPAPVDMADIPVFTGFMGFVYLNWCRISCINRTGKFHHEYHDTKKNYELRKQKKNVSPISSCGHFLVRNPQQVQRDDFLSQ